MAQIREITSEALQSLFRRLLPSQAGFGEDLQATNVITPIIDLTPTAEGSFLPSYLQRGLTYGSQTVFSITNTTTSTIINTPGFFQIQGNATLEQVGGSNDVRLRLTGSGSVKEILNFALSANSSPNGYVPFDFILFLNASETLTGTAQGTTSKIQGSFRQVADIQGNLVNPSGFTAQ